MDDRRRSVDPDRMRGSSRHTLSDVMEFDHVIWSHGDGTVNDAPSGIYAPDLTDDQLDGDPRWEFFTKGYSGQDRYDGPIMHNSESIGARLARDILDTPGYYVSIIARWTPKPEDGDDPDEDIVEGWAIVRMDAPNHPDMLPCGCIPHKTRMTGFGFTCDTEQQGYCNFECPHQEDDDE